MSMNVAASFSVGGCQPQGAGCHRPFPTDRCHRGDHSHHHSDADSPEAPQRNGFLDLLSAPMQALGLKGGNQNDKQYDKYLQANEASNLLKG